MPLHVLAAIVAVLAALLALMAATLEPACGAPWILLAAFRDHGEDAPRLRSELEAAGCSCNGVSDTMYSYKCFCTEARQ